VGRSALRAGVSQPIWDGSGFDDFAWPYAAPLPTEQNQALASTPTADVVGLPVPCHVQAESMTWVKGARLNSLSPGIIMTLLALDELN
jgi:hypothetical protein